MDWTALETWALLLLTAINYGVIAVLILWIVMQRRESPATLAWIFFLLLVPFLGILGFWALGQNRLRRRRWRRRQVGSTIGPRLEPLSRRDAEQTCPCPADEGLLRLARRLDGRSAQPGNDVRLLREGPAAFAALEEAIDAAQHHVHMLYYIWAEDATGARIRDALTRAASRGVEIRLLIDDVGSLATSDAFFRPLQATGARQARFFPLSRLGRRLSLNYRNHRKIAVIDGRVGFTGGMNVADEYAGLGAPWRDAHVRVEGPAVQRLQEIFCEDWYHSTDEDLAQAAYFPTVPAVGDAWVQFLASGPYERHWHAIHSVLFASLNQACERAWFETPYFIPDSSMALALATAALRGVDVRVAVPGRPDVPLVLHAGRSYYTELLAAGVRIFEVPGTFLHAKTACIDGVVGTVGSANLDQRSFGLNLEANAFFYDRALARALEESFLATQEQGVEVQGDDPARLARGTRLLEATARLLSPVL